MVITQNLQETLFNKKIELADILNIHDIKNYRDTSKKAVIITGVTGQDGSFMVDYLLKNTDYQIFGGVRRLSVQNHDNIRHIKDPRFKLINFDLTDSHAISRIVENVNPDYFLNFAAQSFVAASWDFAKQTWETNTTSVLDILEAIRCYAPKCRFYNAGCHSSDTRVMTPGGLKNYKELNVGDVVYSINPKNKDLELKKITKIFEYDYNGELYEFKRGGLLVTPNHKMFYKTKNNNISVKEANEFIKLSDVKYPINNPYKGKILPEFIDLSEFIPIQKKCGNKNYGKHIDKINSYDLMYLMGLYIGDGSCRILTKRKKVSCLFENRCRDKFGKYSREFSQEYIDAEYKCPQCVIDVPPTDNCFPKIVEVLNRNNIRWRLHGQCDITFHQWGLAPYFSECGHSAEFKHIPAWIFDLDNSYQIKVLEGILDSDGDNRDTISTVSSQLQFDLLKLHINCGIMPTFGKRSPRVSVLKDGQEIKGNYPERWVHGLKENTGYQRGNYKKLPYSGKVWCFEVEDNHNFIVERNGKLTFSGNSSEEFGNVAYSPQDENHPLRPRSPYAASKAAGRQLVKVYRESYNLYAVQGWLFNHEGTRRGVEFVSRKITKGVSRIYNMINNPTIGEGVRVDPIELGNLDAKRDWSDAEDFVDAVWKMMNQSKPVDYVISSGETHSIREFVELAFQSVEMEGIWVGSGLDEKYILTNGMNSIGEITLVKINPQFFRPAEVDVLVGDSSKAREELKWNPKVGFKELVRKMVLNDINSL